MYGCVACSVKIISTALGFNENAVSSSSSYASNDAFSSFSTKIEMKRESVRTKHLQENKHINSKGPKRFNDPSTIRIKNYLFEHNKK